jgi:hypothetical protein
MIPGLHQKSFCLDLLGGLDVFFLCTSLSNKKFLVLVVAFAHWSSTLSP